MQQHGDTFRMIVKTFTGLEEVLAEEIRELGGESVKILQRAVEFIGDKELLYKANFRCRSAIRLIKPIAEFAAPDENKLYEEVKKIAWEDYMDNNSTFSIVGTTSYSNITHSKYLALKTKDAIVDRFREATGKRPSVDTFNADLRIDVRVFKDRCTISFDSSGESLHKRGYRKETGPAPLNEVLAAGMILMTGWRGESNFIDPMCGSGTIPIEAAMIAKNIPPGQFRESYSFMNWKDFDKELWTQVCEEARDNIRPLQHKIVASDRSGRILQVAKANMEQAGLRSAITTQVDFIDDVEPPEGKGVMVTNPPYGERIKPDDINKLYESMGDNLKKNFIGYSAWIISSHMEAIKFIGLRPSARIPLNNGQLQCKYLRFDMYEGSKKTSNESNKTNKDNSSIPQRKSPSSRRKRISK